MVMKCYLFVYLQYLSANKKIGVSAFLESLVVYPPPFFDVLFRCYLVAISALSVIEEPNPFAFCNFLDIYFDSIEPFLPRRFM